MLRFPIGLRNALRVSPTTVALAAIVMMGASTKGSEGLSGVYNVKAFGAAGDCAANDTRAIQSAIAAACSAAVRAHSSFMTPTVYLPSGCYLTSFPILMNCQYPINLEGDSDASTQISGGQIGAPAPVIFIEPSGYAADLGPRSAPPLARGPGLALNWDSKHNYFYSLKDATNWNHITSNQVTPLEGLPAFSFEAFVDFAGNGANGGHHYIVSSQGNDTWKAATASGAVNISVVQRSPANDLQACMHLSISGVVCLSGSGTIGKGRTAFIELAYDGSTLRLFVDGRMVASAAARGGVVQLPAESFLLGDYPYTDTPFAYSGSSCCNSGNNHWIGRLDSLRFSNTARHTSNYPAPAGKLAPDGNTMMLINGTASGLADAFLATTNLAGGNAPGSWLPGYWYYGNYPNGSYPSGTANNIRIGNLNLAGGSYGLLITAGLFGTLNNIRANANLVPIKFFGGNSYGWDMYHLDLNSNGGEANFEAFFSYLHNINYLNMIGGYYGMVMADASVNINHSYDAVGSNRLASLELGTCATNNQGSSITDFTIDNESGSAQTPIRLFGGGNWSFRHGTLPLEAPSLGNCAQAALEIEPSAMHGVSLDEVDVASYCSSGPPELVLIHDASNGGLLTPIVWSGCVDNAVPCATIATPLSNAAHAVSLIDGNRYDTEPNDTAIGTTQYGLVKLTSAGAAVGTATSDSNGIIGIVEGGAGKRGVANICAAGYCACAFDGATSAGDWVQISASIATKCHDAGRAKPSSGAIVGRVLSTQGEAGTYKMLVEMQQ